MTFGGKLVDTGRKIILNRGYSAVPTYTAPSVFKIGVGTVAVTTVDTDLNHSVPITGTESVDSCDSITGWSTSNGTVSVNTTTFKEGIGSLNIIKNSVAGSVKPSKTTTSVNFTNKELSLWIYIDSTIYNYLTASNAIEIKFGNDSSNHYYWYKNLSNLISGWNIIDKLTFSNKSGVTGTPTISSINYTAIKINVDDTNSTWTSGSAIVDDIKVVSSDDYTKIFETSYPAFDYNSMQVAIRTRINTLQGNGYLLSEIGMFNTDASPLMESRDTFTPISKTNSDELIFEVVSTLKEG